MIFRGLTPFRAILYSNLLLLALALGVAWVTELTPFAVLLILASAEIYIKARGLIEAITEDNEND